ncbi:MAG: bifunctional ADP-dependent NAD(P)H-hydrate dehydratase/NAD(P)H-hydrate epimerase, partial [Candidatus Altiarchaeales archaeon]
TGNPGMTVGGTGDVLAGILASFLCNPDNSGFIAATAASFISGLAGDLAFQEQSYYFTALDVIDKIPQALKFCEKYF